MEIRRIKLQGLNKDYATSWSYGKMETFNLMIPNLMGGASGSELSEDSDVYQVLKKNRVPNAKNIIKRMPPIGVINLLLQDQFILVQLSAFYLC